MGNTCNAAAESHEISLPVIAETTLVDQAKIANAAGPGGVAVETTKPPGVDSAEGTGETQAAPDGAQTTEPLGGDAAEGTGETQAAPDGAQATEPLASDVAEGTGSGETRAAPDGVDTTKLPEGDATAGTGETQQAEAEKPKLVILLESKDKSETKTVEFLYKPRGFELNKAGRCAPKGPVTVTVGKVEPKGQAASLGVERGWTIKEVNTKPYVTREDLLELIVDAENKLPVVSACN